MRRKQRFAPAPIAGPERPELAVGMACSHNVYGRGVITAIEGEQVRLKMAGGYVIQLGPDLARGLFQE